MSQDFAVLSDIVDSSTGRSHRGAVIRCLGIRECDVSKVGKRNLTSVLQEILDNPLSVLLAKWALKTRKSKRVDDRLPSGQIIERGGTGDQGGGVHGHLDHIPGRDFEVGKIIGKVGEPFVPGAERRSSILSAKIDS